MSSSSYTFETISSLQRLRQIEPALNDLVLRTTPDFFAAPAFLIPWFATANDLGQKPHCITVWNKENTLVGFVPFAVKRDKKALFAKRLSPPRIGTSPPFDAVLSDQIDLEDFTEGVLKLLRKERWIDIAFPYVLESSVFFQHMIRRFEQVGYIIQQIEPYEYLTVENFQSSKDYLSVFKSKKRVERNRQYNRFAKEVDFVELTQPDEMQQASDLIRRVLKGSWKDTPYLNEVFLPLLDRQMRAMAEVKRCRVWGAVNEGTPIAFLVEFLDLDGVPGAYYNAYNDNFKILGPGMNLLQHALRTSLDRGTPTYKFWGDREYIRRLSTHSEAARSLLVRNPSWRAAFGRICIDFAQRLQKQGVLSASAQM